MPAIGLSASAAVILTMLPPVFCACICFTASCGDVNEACEIRRDEGAKVVRCIVRERLHHKDAGIRDHRIDRPKLLKREFCNFLRCFELTYVTIDQSEMIRRLKAPSISSLSVLFLQHCSRGPETLGRLPRRCLATLLLQ